MRIAIAYSNRRIVGGIEAYLARVIPEISGIGHALAFWHEVEGPDDREQIELPLDAPVWSVSDLGAERALAALREWRPDLIYSHGVLDPALEAEMLKVAPAVFFAHGYYGTCISGAKTFKYPVVTPCNRRFGRQCLMHYYPHRCGGLSPVTLFKLYNLQSKRLDNLPLYACIVTHSEHMMAEYAGHGLPVERAYDFPYREAREGADIDLQPPSTWRFLFSGRMDRLKGGDVFLEALPSVVRAIDIPIRVTFAGDGPERESWERMAARISARHEHLSIEFTGWVDQRRMQSLLNDTDLLVVPSLWPEPFGLVGLEAGVMGIPVAAFAVGGIRDWLTDGVNGYLAPGEPPTAAGLAEAIVKCLTDLTAFARLQRGAAQMAERFSMPNHIAALQNIFEKVAARHHAAASSGLNRI